MSEIEAVCSHVSLPPCLSQVQSLLGACRGHLSLWLLARLLEAVSSEPGQRFHLSHGVSYRGCYSWGKLSLSLSFQATSQMSLLQNWVFFWYMASYFWTFFFAVDVYNSKYGGKWKLCCSHYFTWFFCFLFVTCSAASLWSCPPYHKWVHFSFSPSSCGSCCLFMFSCAEDQLCIISHFTSTIGPISIFMAALPIFYISTWRQSEWKATPTCSILQCIFTDVCSEAEC